MIDSFKRYCQSPMIPLLQFYPHLIYIPVEEKVEEEMKSHDVHHPKKKRRRVAKQSKTWRHAPKRIQQPRKAN